MLLPNDPKEIGGIQILDRLGSGGAGIVYKGRDKDNEIVALKILHAEFANNQTVRKRLEREADAMRSVKGNRTVKIRRIEIDVAQPFIVMDFAEGENLANYIANNGVLKGQALNDFALQLAEAIRDIHKAKVIHRDLKPTNVIIGPDGLKVVDFGISIVSEVTGMTQTGLMVGTVSWLSPEQILGKEITEKTDIFNYGLVLGYAATGKHPFGEGKPEAVMYRVLKSEPEIKNITNEYKSEILKYLEKNPNKRINASEIFRTQNNNQLISLNKQNVFSKYRKVLPVLLITAIVVPIMSTINFNNTEEKLKTQKDTDNLPLPLSSSSAKSLESQLPTKSEIIENVEVSENTEKNTLPNKTLNPKLVDFRMCINITHINGITGKSDSKQTCAKDYELEILDGYWDNVPAAIVNIGNNYVGEKLFYCVTNSAFIRFKDIDHTGLTRVNYSEPYGQTVNLDGVNYYEDKSCKKYGNDKVASPTGFRSFAFLNQDSQNIKLTNKKYIDYYFVMHNQNMDRIEIQTILEKVEASNNKQKSDKSISKNSGQICFEKSQENRINKKCKIIEDKEKFFNISKVESNTDLYPYLKVVMTSPWVGLPMCLKKDVRFSTVREINGSRFELRPDNSTVIASSAGGQTNDSCKKEFPPEFLDVTYPVWFDGEIDGNQVGILELRSINENPIIVKATWTPSNI
jgi:serine/threonine protein kinase